MINDLNLIAQFLFSTMDKFVPLYFATGLFGISFSLWVVRKITKLIKRLA